MTPVSTILRVEAPAGDSPPIRLGGAEFWRVSFAMFFGSFATFALLYCVQPLMPGFAHAFSISPAAASLSLSAATGVLAPAMIFAGALSDALGRKTVMTASLAAAGAATLAASFSPDWTTLVALRALTGLALSGVPAVAMAYLAEEMDRSAIGLAMGLYIAGNTVGGLGGRLGAAATADAGGWRWAVGIVGLVSLGSAAAFALALPKERRRPPKAQAIALLPAIRMHCGDPGLRSLFALGFLLMGVLVATYNYIGFRLEAEPFSLSQAAIGLVYSIYLIGAVSSAAMGELAGRFGRRRVIGFAIGLMPVGVVLTLPDNLPLMILGVGVVTVGILRRPFDRLELGRPARRDREGAGERALPLLLLRGGKCCGHDRGLDFRRSEVARGRSLRRRDVGARADDRDQARPRAPAGASARSLRGGVGHGMARRGADHRSAQARRGIGDRRGDDPRSWAPSRSRSRGAVSQAQRDAAGGQHGRRRLARPARRASGRLRGRASGTARGQAHGKRARARRNSTISPRSCGSCPSAIRTRVCMRRRASSPTRSTRPCWRPR